MTNNDKEKEQSAWKKYFSGWNFLINGLIALIPASLVIGILREIGLRGALVTMGTLFGFIYLAGFTREKISGKKSKITAQKTAENNSEVQKLQTNKKSTKNKWIWAGVIVVAIIFIVAVFSILPNEQDVELVKTDKSGDYSEQDGNFYRNTKYDFRIKFPEGWDIKTGDGPNILQKAVKGNHTVSIGVREIPAEFGDKTATIKDVMSITEFKDTLLEGVQEKFPGAKIIDYGESKLDNKHAYWIKYSAPYTALDITVEGIQVQYQVLNNNIFYFITAGSTSDEYKSVEAEIMKSISTFVIEEY